MCSQNVKQALEQPNRTLFHLSRMCSCAAGFSQPLARGHGPAALAQQPPVHNEALGEAPVEHTLMHTCWLPLAPRACATRWQLVSASCGLPCNDTAWRRVPVLGGRLGWREGRWHWRAQPFLGEVLPGAAGRAAGLGGGIFQVATHLGCLCQPRYSINQFSDCMFDLSCISKRLVNHRPAGQLEVILRLRGGGCLPKRLRRRERRRIPQSKYPVAQQ